MALMNTRLILRLYYLNTIKSIILQQVGTKQSACDLLNSCSLDCCFKTNKNLVAHLSTNLTTQNSNSITLVNFKNLDMILINSNLYSKVIVKALNLDGMETAYY